MALYDTELRGHRLLDQVTYDCLAADTTYGRYPNGAVDWATLGASTPGGPTI